MQRILVTGANKGIGLATVEAILREHPGTGVILAARDPGRGAGARDSLLDENPDWKARLDVLELDVADDESVQAAADRLGEKYGDEPAPLSGLVNNAGVPGDRSLAEVLNVNAYGVHRVCRQFVPLIRTGGRVVNVTSAAGPNFVADCSAEWRRFFTNADLTWEQLHQFMQDCQDLTPEDFEARGLGSGRSYGLSKACANLYTLMLARQHPELVINACTPGFIETDLGLRFIGNRTPAEAGMKTPADGARVVMFLLFDQPQGSGHYYGSDSRRSPLDRYRAPGSPPYTGD